MAENPPISDNGIPFQVSNEMFVLERKNIEIEVKLDNCKDWGKRSATGKLYMTTCRLVFVNDNFRNSDFKSFDIPLFYIFQEKFVQPIIFQNYLDSNEFQSFLDDYHLIIPFLSYSSILLVKVKPLYGLIPDVASVKLWFKSGGCHKFLKLFDIVIRSVRQFKRKNQTNQLDQNGQLANNVADSGLIDPNTIVDTQTEKQLNEKEQEITQYQLQQQQQQSSGDKQTFTEEQNLYNQHPSDQQYKNKEQLYSPVLLQQQELNFTSSELKKIQQHNSNQQQQQNSLQRQHQRNQQRKQDSTLYFDFQF